MIEVWAPRAERVRLHRPGADDVELRRGESGWWRSDVELAPGDKYGFLLGDAADPRPDPRSRRQPDGVHGLSAVDDPAAFAWTDDAWTGRPVAGGLVYEMHIGTFTGPGTLDAAIARLDHLVELGVTHVELLPVNAFNGTHNWGYDGVLWYAVQESYGGPDAYRRFVDAAHAAGLAVIQDVVYNHLGPSGNYLPEYGPYLRDGRRNTWGDSVNLDERAVRDYIIENAEMWLRDFHVDGLRLDAVHALHDDDSPVHLLAELAQRVDALSAHLGRPLTLIAESDMNDPTMILPAEAKGYGITAQWSDDWHHAVHVALTGETVGYYADFDELDALPKVWSGGFFHDGTYSSFRGRAHGRPIPPESPSWRLVTFAQDHDQIGNRAAGDRLSATLSADRLAIAAVLTLTAPGTPMLFMGEEWGASTPWQFFTSHPEPELAEATAAGRKQEFAEMGWDEDLVPDPNEESTFLRSKLDWSEADGGASARLLDLYRRLGRLRREQPDLTDPRFGSRGAAASEVEGGRVYDLQRGRARVVVNLSPQPWRIELEGVSRSSGAGRDGDERDEVWLETLPAERLDGALVVAPESAVIVGPSLSRR
ncbi:malto-oligosyltrehalose trehalohydrolase [Microbacterium radiodurans]|uniref:Malto-oligosyltrehalose trehalohydrolase n=1 Tax=Microbacterium radiodurans TaxID=661398 RepID=A0A5J5IT55_9MICO|nr:malto-oligosyltrehalose trehalohydrolase [Microbacterium radiodurans]KAA9089038.1 malto-oligosyltrehalose trehalohydrolase [Microbacterium radiodurans]